MQLGSAQAFGLLEQRQSHRLTIRLLTEVAVTVIGIALVVCAVLANHSWFLRHFLPTFFAPFEIYVVGAQVGRVVVAALGTSLALQLRPRLGCLVVRTPARQLAAGGARIL